MKHLYFLILIFSFKAFCQVGFYVHRMQIKVEQLSHDTQSAWWEIQPIININKTFSLHPNFKGGSNNLTAENNNLDYSTSSFKQLSLSIKPYFKVKDENGQVIGVFASFGYGNIKYFADKSSNNSGYDLFSLSNNSPFLGLGAVYISKRVNGEIEMNFLTKDKIKQLIADIEYQPLKNFLLTFNGKFEHYENSQFRQTSTSITALYPLGSSALRLGPTLEYNNFGKGIFNTSFNRLTYGFTVHFGLNRITDEKIKQL